MKNKKLNYTLYFYISKKLKIGTSFLGGTNNSGHICVHHQCGGAKRNLFLIDFYRRIDSYGILYKIIKDLNRTAFLAGIIYDNGLFSYIISTEGLKIGDKIYSGSFKNYNDDLKNGYTALLGFINLFTIINNIEIKPYSGSILSRSAGTCSLLIAKINNSVLIKLKSGWNVYLSKYCLAVIGNVSNMGHKFLDLKKAGRSFKLGERPTVRGLAKNAVDHPHGGGEGRKSQLPSPKSPWGSLCKNSPTKNKKFQLLKKKKFKLIR